MTDTINNDINLEFDRINDPELLNILKLNYNNHEIPVVLDLISYVVFYLDSLEVKYTPEVKFISFVYLVNLLKLELIENKFGEIKENLITFIENYNNNFEKYKETLVQSESEYRYLVSFLKNELLTKSLTKSK